jgi:hypothetical protein
MGDLEDRFLKKNVPGRWSSFERRDERKEEDSFHEEFVL